MLHSREFVRRILFFYYFGATAPSWPGPPHSQNF